MLDLTAPRVHAGNAHRYRQLGLDSLDFKRSRALLARALRDGTYRTRAELASVHQRAGIATDGQRLAYLMMHAELERVICSGPRRGKQFTYALLEERAPRARNLTREEGLAELTRRYFTSHGPATVRDYAWWSGLAMKEARAGIDLLGRALGAERIGERVWWSPRSRAAAPPAALSAHLLPNHDEYLIAYQDRDLVVHAPGKDVFAHHLILNGLLAGSWMRTATAASVTVDVAPYRKLTLHEERAVGAAVARYGRFMQIPAVLSLRPFDRGRRSR